MSKLPERAAPGQIDFMNRFNLNVKDGKIPCELCGVSLYVKGPTLVSMHVFTYSDHPHYTTKALCFNCMNKELKACGMKPITNHSN